VVGKLIVQGGPFALSHGGSGQSADRAILVSIAQLVAYLTALPILQVSKRVNMAEPRGLQLRFLLTNDPACMASVEVCMGITPMRNRAHGPCFDINAD
jgi:hypothetical protein